MLEIIYVSILVALVLIVKLLINKSTKHKYIIKHVEYIINEKTGIKYIAKIWYEYPDKT